MIYEIKKYGEEEFLIVSDPYTSQRLEAIQIDPEDTPENSIDLFRCRFLTYYPYLDFNNYIEYIIYVNLFNKGGKNLEEKSHYITTLSNVLNIPATQAEQLVLFNSYRENVKVFSSKSFKEAYAISYNLFMCDIVNEVVLFENNK
jgi:hypothetical protein